MKRKRWWLVGAAAASYTAAFFLPVARVYDSEGVLIGHEAFRMIWEGIFQPGPASDRWIGIGVWLANPATWMALLLVLFGRWRAARAVSAVGVLSGGLAAWYFPFLLNESGFWL